MHCRNLTFDFSDGNLDPLPDYGSANFLCDYLKVTNKTLKRYRDLAILIPDYLKCCDRVWRHKTGNNYEEILIKARVCKTQAPIVDQPPFYKPQMIILLGVAELVKASDGKYWIARSRILQNPRIWQNYVPNF